MDLELEGKVAWVTGGAGGIGSAIATVLAQEGADIALTGRTASTLEQTADRISGTTGRPAVAVPADVTDNASVVAAAEQIVARLGSLDILVNSAATLGGRTGQLAGDRHGC